METVDSDCAAAIRVGEHVCCRLAHAEDRERLALAFVLSGLRRGEKVLYLAAREDTGAFATQLAGDDRLASAMNAGQLEMRDARDAYTQTGPFDARETLEAMNAEHRAALAGGYAGLSLTVEMSWALDLPRSEELDAYEDGYSARVGRGTFAVFCQYDHARFGAGTLHHVAAAHDADISPELAAIGRDGYFAAARVGTGAAALLRLAGDLDFDCCASLVGVLDAHFHGKLRLDLTDLSFVDVAGMRALRGRTGQPLEIVAASTAVHRLLALLAWGTDPMIEVPSVSAA
jgi:ABC-type transporter Mla MlaB component